MRENITAAQSERLCGGEKVRRPSSGSTASPRNQCASLCHLFKSSYGSLSQPQLPCGEKNNCIFTLSEAIFWTHDRWSCETVGLLECGCVRLKAAFSWKKKMHFGKSMYTLPWRRIKMNDTCSWSNIGTKQWKSPSNIHGGEHLCS